MVALIIQTIKIMQYSVIPVTKNYIKIKTIIKDKFISLKCIKKIYLKKKIKSNCDKNNIFMNRDDYRFEKIDNTIL